MRRDGRIGARVEEGAHARDDQLPGILDPADALADVGHERLLELLVHGTEEVALVGEVVVQGARVTPASATISSVPTPAKPRSAKRRRPTPRAWQPRAWPCRRARAGARRRRLAALRAGFASPGTYSLYATRIQPVWKEPA